MQQQISSGAGVIVKINGAPIGFATGLSWQRSQNIKPIYEIDSVVPKELAPTIYSVSGSLSGLSLIYGTGLDGPGIMDISTIDAFFYQKYVVIEIVDRRTNRITNTFKNVIFSSDSWRINAKSINTFSASFIAQFMENTASNAT